MAKDIKKLGKDLKEINDLLSKMVPAAPAVEAAPTPAEAPVSTEHAVKSATAEAAPAEESREMTPDEISKLIADGIASAMPTVTETVTTAVKGQVDEQLGAFREGRVTPFEQPKAAAAAGALGIPQVPAYLRETSEISNPQVYHWIQAVGTKASMDKIESIRYALDQKALAESTFAAVPNSGSPLTNGGALVPIAFAQSIVDYLYPLVAVRKSGAPTMPMPAAEVLIPVLNGIPSPATQQEGTLIPGSVPAFSQVKLVAKVIAGLVPVSRQLVEDSSPAVEAILRQAIARSMGVQEDWNFLVGDGSTTGTLQNLTGLFNQAGISTVTAADTTNGKIAWDDLVNVIVTAQGNNVPLTKPVWYTSPAGLGVIRRMKDSQNRPLFTNFVDATATGGIDLTVQGLYGSDTPKLMGYPVYVSQQIPTKTVGTVTNAYQLALVDLDYVVIGERSGMVLETSTDASYADAGAGTTLTSAFAQHQMLFKAVERLDIALTHGAAMTVLNGFKTA